MLASRLVQKLQAEIEQHGDLDVLGYAEDSDSEYDDISTEYNNDDAPVILLTLGRSKGV